MRPLVRLRGALQAWGSDRFARRLKRELEGLPPGSLPLSQATTQGGYVDDRQISVSVLGVRDTGSSIDVRLALFFTERVGGCSCGDDPMALNAHCELRLRLDKATADAAFELLNES